MTCVVVAEGYDRQMAYTIKFWLLPVLFFAYAVQPFPPLSWVYTETPTFTMNPPPVTTVPEGQVAVVES
jgi:hypothetical protein